jgi:hypothetical protein
VFRVYFVSDTAQVELDKWTSVSPWLVDMKLRRMQHEVQVTEAEPHRRRSTRDFNLHFLS